jgi:hypothetical protein
MMVVDCGYELTVNYGPSSACDVHCTGNDNQVCGGIDAINVYEYSQVVPSYDGYTVRGCVG